MFNATELFTNRGMVHQHENVEVIKEYKSIQRTEGISIHEPKKDFIK